MRLRFFFPEAVFVPLASSGDLAANGAAVQGIEDALFVAAVIGPPFASMVCGLKKSGCLDAAEKRALIMADAAGTPTGYAAEPKCCNAVQLIESLKGRSSPVSSGLDHQGLPKMPRLPKTVEWYHSRISIQLDF
jgi:hypothetical protein